MKACIKAWQDIYNQDGLITDELTLQALECILYGPVWTIDTLTEKTKEDMVKEFSARYPLFHYDHMEIIIDEKQER